jgi:hypothetical protein
MALGDDGMITSLDQYSSSKPGGRYIRPFRVTGSTVTFHYKYHTEFIKYPNGQ